jgi:hypothetical protein
LLVIALTVDLLHCSQHQQQQLQGGVANSSDQMEWERFFSQSQASAAPPSTAINNYDAARNINANPGNVGVIGAGRQNPPSGGSYVGAAGSGRMGPNYSVATSFPQGHGQSPAINNNSSVTRDLPRDVFVNPLPTTYGGVERANQLLRSLHEQPQDPADNTYYPSSQPQSQSQPLSQRSAYDPVGPGPALNTAPIRVQGQGQGQSIPNQNQNLGPVNGGSYQRPTGYDQRHNQGQGQGQGQIGPIGGSLQRADDSSAGGYLKPISHAAQGQLSMDQMAPQAGYRGLGTGQDLLNSSVQLQSQPYHSQGQVQGQGQIQGNQSAYRQQGQVNGSLPSQTAYRGSGQQESIAIQGAGHDRGGADPRYSALPQQQGLLGRPSGSQGQGQGQGQGAFSSQSISAQGQGQGQGQGSTQWQQQQPVNRAAINPQIVNDYPVTGAGDLGGRGYTGRDYPQAAFQASPAATQPYVTNNTSQVQQRYPNAQAAAVSNLGLGPGPNPGGIVAGDVRYKAPVDQRDVRDQRDVYSSTQGQGQGQSQYLGKAQVVPQYQHQQPPQQLQQQQLPMQQSQSQFSHSNQNQNQNQINSQNQNINQSQAHHVNSSQQYQVQRSQDTPYSAPVSQISGNLNQNQGINMGLNQGQSQSLGLGVGQGQGQNLNQGLNQNQNQNHFQTQHSTPQSQSQQAAQRAPSRFNLPQGPPSLGPTPHTADNVPSAHGRYGHQGSYVL